MAAEEPRVSPEAMVATVAVWVAATFPVAPTATSRANAEPRGSQILIASWLEFRRPPLP